jgi:Mce-associated membrane protein
VSSLSTGSFRSEYEHTFDQGLGQLIEKVKATAVATVKDIYVSKIDSDGGQAIVVADVTTKGPSGTHTLYDQYVLLSFVRSGGKWKVDDVTDLNFAQANALSGGTSPSGSTTSTTTPVP